MYGIFSVHQHLLIDKKNRLLNTNSIHVMILFVKLFFYFNAKKSYKYYNVSTASGNSCANAFFMTD